MKLTIKGARSDAVAAAQARAVPVLDVMHETPDPWTIVQTRDDDETARRVAAWYVEPIPATAGEPFPVGTLLLYGERAP